MVQWFSHNLRYYKNKLITKVLLQCTVEFNPTIYCYYSIIFQVIDAMHDNLRGGANFQVVAKRRFAYFIISVYLPSLSLWAVTHITNFISVDHFEANIMVHLTAMLVSYTLFQATSISLPTVIFQMVISYKFFHRSFLDCLHQADRCLASLWPHIAFSWIYSHMSRRNLQNTQK